MLNKTDSGCDGCHVVDDGLMSYPVLWTMSCNDYYWATGDMRGFASFARDAAAILDKALATFLQRPPVEFMGWDDRLDNGFCGTCTDARPPRGGAVFGVPLRRQTLFCWG